MRTTVRRAPVAPIWDLDEDEMMRFLSSGHADCPYWRPGDEYLLSRRQ